jgi:hypothetical protein
MQKQKLLPGEQKYFLPNSETFDETLFLRQPRSQDLSFCHLGETLAAAGHVRPRFWEVNLIVTVRGVGKERVCSVLKLQLWVMKFTVNLQQEIVKRILKLIFIS